MRVRLGEAAEGANLAVGRFERGRWANSLLGEADIGAIELAGASTWHSPLDLLEYIHLISTERLVQRWASQSLRKRCS